MSLKLCCVSPHPPILVREVGREEVRKVKASSDALNQLAGDIIEAEPRTIVVMSPHSPVHPDAFVVQCEEEMSGSFAQFRAPQVRIEAPGDERFAKLLEEHARKHRVPVARRIKGEPGSGVLDHGVLVPLYFLAPTEYMLVCLSITFIGYREHFAMGMAIRDAAEAYGRSVVFIASGDLSHRLTREAPAGYEPDAHMFDDEIVEIFREADFARLQRLDPRLVVDAGECGLRSIFALAGAIDGCSVSSDVLSYEGPFGVGYMVARVRPEGPDETRKLSFGEAR